jgi:hypothetical protein
MMKPLNFLHYPHKEFKAILHNINNIEELQRVNSACLRQHMRYRGNLVRSRINRLVGWRKYDIDLRDRL